MKLLLASSKDDGKKPTIIVPYMTSGKPS